MSWIDPRRAALALMGAAVLTPPAAAAPARILVSAKTGEDKAGCGTQAAPCRTFQAAHDAVAAGGEIQAVDPGDYGPLRIVKSVSVVNNSFGVAGVLTVPGFVNAIVIDGAATDRIYLRGLTVDAAPGPNGPGGLNGVLVNTQGIVAMSRITVRHYNIGINICPRSGPAVFTVSDSYVTENNQGLAIMAEEPPGSTMGVIARTVSVNNYYFGLHSSGDNAAAPAQTTIVDSLFANNPIAGIYLVSNTTPTRLTLRNVVASHGTHWDPAHGAGFYFEGGSVTVHLAHSTATGNNHGVKATGGAKVESYGDNILRGNIIDAVDTSAGGSFVVVSNQ